MGWCSGDPLLADVWMEVYPHIPEEARNDVLKRVIRVFMMNDLDCFDRIMEMPGGKKALKELKPHWFDFDEEEENGC